MFYVVAFAVGAAFGSSAGETRRERLRAFVLRNPPLLAVVLALLAPDSLAPDAMVDLATVLVYAILPVGFFVLGVNLAAESGTTLAIIAAGTGNDVARGLGLPVHDPVRAADLVTTGVPRRIDAGRHTDDRGERHWFAGVLGAGFDSLVNERANTWPWPKGRMRYNLAILRELPLFRAIPYVVTVDGVRHETRAMLVAVGNGPSYGGGMRVLPDAEFDDGLLDVLIVHDVSTTEFLKVFPKVFKGAHTTHPAVEILRGRQVTLEARGIVAYADGERFAPLPLSVEAVPGALTVLAPRSRI